MFIERKDIKMLKSENLKITTIIEDASNSTYLLGQKGLSILIETGKHNFLIDTGASSFVTHNVEELGINLDLVETIILSHGHFDHTGGLQAILRKMKKKSTQIVAHPEAWGLKYRKKNNKEEYNYIGIPFRPEELERYGAQFELTAKPTWLTEDIAVSGEEPMTTSFEHLVKYFYVKKNNEYILDSCMDDQSVYIRTELGLIIILGCAHRGMINIIKHAQQLMKTDKVYMIIGGTHLGPAPEEQIISTIKALKDIDIQWLGVSHCTGLKVAAKLSEIFKEKFFFNNTGTIIKFPFKQ
jgi:7,8-dihydropterin-6-yl-methyl-4-(beta-D-ribofuranosyl)aminobenzene 5'-phosphate synthase